MQLVCRATYRNSGRGLEYFAGATYDVDETLGAYLLADSPGSFEVAGATADDTSDDDDGAESRAFDGPPVDRQVRPRKRRGAGESDEG